MNGRRYTYAVFSSERFLCVANTAGVRMLKFTETAVQDWMMRALKGLTKTISAQIMPMSAVASVGLLLFVYRMNEERRQDNNCSLGGVHKIMIVNLAAKWPSSCVPRSTAAVCLRWLKQGGRVSRFLQARNEQGRLDFCVECKKYLFRASMRLRF